MARLSRSNFPPVRRSAFAGLLLCLLLGACASGPRGATFSDWPPDDDDVTARYLLTLREYLARPAGDQAAHRERLRVNAEHGGGAAELEYAFALSVDRNDAASLEAARSTFEQLLAAPDPLPVALDALVRLQLGQVRDRLERMQASGEIHDAYRAAATGQKMCHARLEDTTARLDAMRNELREVRRKLDALARIEQTVNGNDGPPEEQLPPRAERNEEQDQEKDDDAERPPDTARR
ncbi:MAG TPA: hypothetical protein VF267_04510 [Gammaproteobacteria bacterium]